MTNKIVNPFADYDAWYKNNGNQRGCGDLGGTFQWRFLTPRGIYIYNGIKDLIGYNCKFRGVRREGVYFKWQLKKEEDRLNIEVAAADWIREQGHTVKVASGSCKAFEGQKILTEASAAKRGLETKGQAWGLSKGGQRLFWVAYYVPARHFVKLTLS